MNSESAAGPPLHLLRVTLLFASFLGYSAVQSPVPGVNEPHYLAKARHYWQPEWCAGDLFLESANAHLFFYQTVGWLTAVCALEQAAWCGRVLALLLLAVGWDQLFSRLVVPRFGPLWACWLFLLLHTIGNFSGEWLVGGVEAKVISYAFVFWGCGRLLRGDALGTAAALGLAVSLHPVVGGWSVACVVVATVIAGRNGPNPERDALLQSLRPPRGLASVAVFLVLSLPGLIPAVELLLSNDPGLVRRANFIQFTHRLPHHLDPQAFSEFSYWYYGAMIAVWLGIVVARLWIPEREAWSWPVKWFQWLVAASIVVAVAGCLTGLGNRPLPVGDVRLTLLKFYPFRLADLLVPLLVSVLAVSVVEHRSIRTRAKLTAAFVAFGIALAASILIPGKDSSPSGMDDFHRNAWLDVCRWVRTETPVDSIIYAPHEDWALRWYCQRPVYVRFKDCPQDAAGIVEWYERQRSLGDWSRRAFADDIADATELRELHETTGISYLVSREFPGLDRSPLYHNESFYVYGVGPEHLTTGESGE